MSRRSYQFASEDDRFNCKFYFKIGACRHGDRCSRQHIRPVLSATLMIPNLYLPPPAELPNGGRLSPKDLQEHFEDFYEDIYDEAKKYGKVIELVVLQNLGDHMFGNTYIKFAEEESARACMQGINGRYYCGRQIDSAFNPVTSFRDARCKSFEHGHCQRGGYCNFMHLRQPPRWIDRKIRDNRDQAIRDARRVTRRDTPQFYFTARTSSPERRRTIARWNRDLEDSERRRRERDPEAYDREQAEKKMKEAKAAQSGTVAPEDTCLELAAEAMRMDASALRDNVSGGRGHMSYGTGSQYPIGRVTAPQVSAR